jgi:hypothetical protein
MDRSRSPEAPASLTASPRSFLDCLGYFLTPQVWKQAQQAMARRGCRWQIRPLLFVVLAMTWGSGDSLPERFETAKAFYIASYQSRRRPGKTFVGFQKAWAKLPMPVLRTVARAVRCRLAHVFADRWRVDGFIPLGCDGSRLTCPRSAEFEQRLGMDNEHSPPTIWVTAVVHLSSGLLWSWRLGKGSASERDHLRRLLPTLPPSTLLVADAGYVGYELLQALRASSVCFLIRLSSTAPLYTSERLAWSRIREGLAYYWPQWAQQQHRPPIPVRVLRIRGRKADVWLMTNVVDAQRLPRPSAGRFYRWRWRNEGLFRTYKRTLQKVKLMSRTVALAHREAEGSLLAVQLLLAQGAQALPTPSTAIIPRSSARKVLVEVRMEIRNVVGMYLGPRQRQTYAERLLQACWQRRRQRTPKVRRPWPARKDHKPPGPPTILKMGTDLKDQLQQSLGRLCG